MNQDPNPKDDPEMEKFCDWLYTAGFSNQMSFDHMKEVWLRGRCDYYGKRIGESGSLSQLEYELLTYLYRKSYEQLEKHLLTHADAPPWIGTMA